MPRMQALRVERRHRGFQPVVWFWGSVVGFGLQPVVGFGLQPVVGFWGLWFVFQPVASGV